MACITKRGNKWCVQVRKSGHASINKTFGRLTDARLWAHETEKDLETGKLDRLFEARKHDFSELAEKYIAEILPQKRNSTTKSQFSQIQRWRTELGRLKLADLNADLLIAARDRLQKRHNFGNATANRYMSLLHHCLNCAVNRFRSARGLPWLPENPLKYSQYKYHGCETERCRFLTEDEMQRLLQKSDRHDSLRTIVAIALHTGMRKGEILGLTWDQVDLRNRTIYLKDTKNREPRLIPLVHGAHRALQEWGKVRRIDSRLVFPSKRNPKVPLSIHHLFQNLLKEAEIEGFRFHDLRHTTASYLAMAGVDTLTISAILGHRSLNMSRRYAHLSQQFKKESLEKLCFYSS